MITVTFKIENDPAKGSLSIQGNSDGIGDEVEAHIARRIIDQLDAVKSELSAGFGKPPDVDQRTDRVTPISRG